MEAFALCWSPLGPFSSSLHPFDIVVVVVVVVVAVVVVIIVVVVDASHSSQIALCLSWSSLKWTAQ